MHGYTVKLKSAPSERDSAGPVRPVPHGQGRSGRSLLSFRGAVAATSACIADMNGRPGWSGNGRYPGDPRFYGVGIGAGSLIGTCVVRGDGESEIGAAQSPRTLRGRVLSPLWWDFPRPPHAGLVVYDLPERSTRIVIMRVGFDRPVAIVPCGGSGTERTSPGPFRSGRGKRT